MPQTIPDRIEKKIVLRAPPSRVWRALTSGTRISRQAVTKHLAVLARAGLVESERLGRERLWALAPGRIHEARRALEQISREWDDALGRLRKLVER